MTTNTDAGGASSRWAPSWCSPRWLSRAATATRADVDVNHFGVPRSMTVIGFPRSHEQIDPAQLLQDVQDVQDTEQAGFTAAMSADHFSPWSERQGESGFAWAFLGSALATTGLPFGVVNGPGAALPPGDHRPGDRHAGADVPWSVLGRAGLG